MLPTRSAQDGAGFGLSLRTAVEQRRLCRVRHVVKTKPGRSRYAHPRLRLLVRRLIRHDSVRGWMFPSARWFAASFVALAGTFEVPPGARAARGASSAAPLARGALLAGALSPPPTGA